MLGHLDPEDNQPGRRCRAHIRAAFDDALSGEEQLWSDPAILGALLAVPAVLAQARESGQSWRSELTGDGLHPDRALLIARVLDGEWIGVLIAGRIEPAERERSRDLLLALTRDSGPLPR